MYEYLTFKAQITYNHGSNCVSRGIIIGRHKNLNSQLCNFNANRLFRGPNGGKHPNYSIDKFVSDIIVDVNRSSRLRKLR